MLRYKLLIVTATLILFACNNEDRSTGKPNFNPGEQTMDSITTEIAKARNFQEKGQYKEASMIADAMIEKYPGQLDALSIKAEILKAEGRPAEALAIMEKAYSLEPRDKELAYDLAYEYADAKNSKALSLTDTLIRYDKAQTVARAWYIKGTYFNNMGNQKEALRYYDSSIVADYNFLDSYLDKGKLLLQQKKYDAALKAFATGQKLAPAAAEFYFWVAKTQEAMGQPEDAKANYETAFSLDKTMTEARDAAKRL